MTAAAAAMYAVGGPARWEPVTARAPRLGATMLTYLDQLAVSQRPATVQSTDTALRLFASFVLDHDPKVRSARQVQRRHIEAYKRTLVEPRQPDGRRLKNTTVRMLRLFFERIIEWGWDNAPARCPVFEADLPKVDDPLPKFLDDASAARFMRAAALLDPLRRLVVEMLARTGMRVSELCDLPADAVMIIGDAHWLRIPVGKLHHDRLIPLHPALVDQLAAWRTSVGPDDSGLLLTNHGRPLNRYSVNRIVKRVGRSVGIDDMHAHRLRHTLATQAKPSGVAADATFGVRRERAAARELEVPSVA